MLKFNDNKHIKKFFIYFFVGYTFFFTSKYWMDFDKQDIKVMQIGEMKSSGNVEFILANVLMTQDEDEITIVLEKEDLLYTGNISYKFYERENSERKRVDLKKEEKEEFVILKASGINPKSSQFQLVIKLDDSDIRMNFDDEYISKEDYQDDEDIESFRSKIADIKISSYKKEIKNKQDEILKKEKSISESLEKIKKLESEKEFKTDEEQAKVDDKINTIKSSIAAENERMNKLRDEISSFYKKIDKLEERKKASKASN